MEIVNIKYITLNGQSFFKEECNLVPAYVELKKLQPVIVNDKLELEPEKTNVDLLNCYIGNRFLLVPVRRKPKAKEIKRSPGFPSRILLEITSRCNLRCVMCPRNLLKRPVIDMPKSLILRCIDEIDEHGVDGLWLYNVGEALLHPDFYEIFAYCQTKKNLGSLWLSTNGQELSDKMIDTLISSNLTFLNFSLNAMNKESYKLLSPKGNYEKKLINLKRILKRKKDSKKMGKPPWIRLQMIDQPQVISEIDLFLERYAPEYEMLSVNLLEAFTQNAAHDIEYIKKRKRPLKKYCKRIKRNDCFIFSDGGVSVCDTDFNHEMEIGDVKNSTIQGVWNGQIHKRYKELNEKGQLDEIPLCRQCLDYDL